MTGITGVRRVGWTTGHWLGESHVRLPPHTRSYEVAERHLEERRMFGGTHLEEERHLHGEVW